MEERTTYTVKSLQILFWEGQPSSSGRKQKEGLPTGQGSGLATSPPACEKHGRPASKPSAMSLRTRPRGVESQAQPCPRGSRRPAHLQNPRQVTGCCRPLPVGGLTCVMERAALWFPGRARGRKEYCW